MNVTDSRGQIAGIVVAQIVAAALVAPFASASDVSHLQADENRIERRIEALSAFGATADGGVSRLAYSDADIEGRAYVRALMTDAGLAVHTDAAGNLVGRRDGSEPGLVPIAIGSHIDTVRNGGNYDGNVGVIGALEVVELLNGAGLMTRHPVEVISFGDEEAGMIGSRAMAIGVDASTLELQSDSGFTVAEGMRRVGGDPERADRAKRDYGDIAAFVELHVEQGGILHGDGIDIGVVEGIVGIGRWNIDVTGVANHAGTTPMDRRHDALVSAALLTLAVNRIAEETPGRHVATVGRLEVEPGAINVIPGRVRMSLELRDLDAMKMQAIFAAIESEAGMVERQRGTPIRFERLNVASEPTLTDPRLRRLIASAASELGLESMSMPSGAGHDTQEMSKLGPAAMIFVPSVDGVSHSPREFTSAADIANGVNVLLRVVLAVDAGALTEAMH